MGLDLAQVSRRPSTVDRNVSMDLASGTVTDSLWDDMGSLTGTRAPEYEFTHDQEAIILELEAAMTKAAMAGLWLALSEVRLFALNHAFHASISPHWTFSGVWQGTLSVVVPMLPLLRSLISFGDHAASYLLAGHYCPSASQYICSPIPLPLLVSPSLCPSLIPF